MAQSFFVKTYTEIHTIIQSRHSTTAFCGNSVYHDHYFHLDTDMFKQRCRNNRNSDQKIWNGIWETSFEKEYLFFIKSTEYSFLTANAILKAKQKFLRTIQMMWNKVLYFAFYKDCKSLPLNSLRRFSRGDSNKFLRFTHFPNPR